MTEQQTQEQQQTSDETQNTETQEAQEQQVYRSQEDVDKAIQTRLARERKKWEREAAERAEAERKKAQMDEAQKAQAEKEEAEARAAQREQKADERVIRAEAKVQALDAGAKPERVAALLRLSDLSEVEMLDDGEPDAKAVKKAVEAALEEYSEFKAGTSVNADGFNPPDEQDSGEVTQEQFDKMSYQEKADLYNRDLDLYNRLSIGA